MKPIVAWSQVVLATMLAATALAAPSDPYRITAKEKAACTADAIRLCAFTYPDESKLLDCMKSNRGSLSQVCLVAFDAGMKRRRLD